MNADDLARLLRIIGKIKSMYPARMDKLTERVESFFVASFIRGFYSATDLFATTRRFTDNEKKYLDFKLSREWSSFDESMCNGQDELIDKITKKAIDIIYCETHMRRQYAVCLLDEVKRLNNFLEEIQKEIARENTMG